MSSRLKILEASAPDLAPTLSTLASRTFRDAYEGAIAPDLVEEYVAENFTPTRLASELTDPRNVFLLAMEEDVAIGYAKVSRSAPPASLPLPGPLELSRLYVDKPRWGAGVGPSLMRGVLDLASRMEDTETLWLAVWEHNPRAIAFYRRWGFGDVGSMPFPMGQEIQTDRVMIRPISRAGR